MTKQLPEIVKEQQDLALEIYLEQAKNKGLEISQLKQFLPPIVNQDLQKSVEEFFKLSPERQKEFAAHLARIADLQTRVRNSANSKFADYFSKDSPADASSSIYVFDKFLEAKISKEQLQEMLNQIIISNSITAHPTNPYSTQYTIESMELDRILAQENSQEKSSRLAQQISKMIDLSPVSDVRAENKGKKTQADEVREAMAYMKNIYHNLPKAKKEMMQILSEYKEYQDLEIGNFYDMGAWLSGDGDGNPNATPESLQQNIELFRAEIIDLYLQDLAKIISIIQQEFNNGNCDAEDLNYVLSIQEKLLENEYDSPSEFVEELEDMILPQDLYALVENDLTDLIYRAQNFGFRYAKIDIRHDASDINKVVADILIALGKLNTQDKKQFLDDLSSNNKEAIAKQSALISEALEVDLENIDTTNFEEVSKRIFGRLQVVARNPECSDKLIIAECKNQANALGALLLLRTSGNSTHQANSLKIVTLSESADDLIALPQNIEALLENEIYRQHIIATGSLIYMIAKSDTQRRDGVAAQYAQELPPEEITKLFAKTIKKYPELKNVTLVPYNGGGHALQRGGGRIDEIPNIYGKAAMRGIYWSQDDEIVDLAQDLKIAPPVLTTQGHQNGILFSQDSAGNFLSSYYSQAIYAFAKQKQIIAEPEVLNADGAINQQAMEARRMRQLYFQKAREVYKKEIATADSPINQLFRNGPWAGCDLCNVSSRPGKKPGANKTPQLIDQRAIGAEKMCAHSGTHLISWYSARQGINAIIAKYGFEDAKLMYANDKATRDSFRSMAISLFMTDFKVAWEMMIGENRPSNIESIKFFAESYPPIAETDKKTQLKITLAHIEQEAIETAKLLYQIISGREVDQNFKPQDLLNYSWPELAKEIADREQRLEFSHHLEAKLTSDLNKKGRQNPEETEEGKQTQQIIRNIHTACIGSEAPKGSMQTLTKIQDDKPRSGHCFDVPEELESLISITGRSFKKTPGTELKPRDKTPNKLKQEQNLSLGAT